MEDWRLLREYVDNGSEAAFAALVDRHIGLVYSAALRHVRDQQSAKEITQSVFCLLARKARRLRSDTALVSWLYRTACFQAARYWRAESRRRKWEEEAVRMQSLEPASEEVWTALAPHLDSAMKQLAEPDRLAILLRFFQKKSLREVAAALGITEEAARKRVERAVDKLRSALLRKGVTCSAAVLSLALGRCVVEAVPNSIAMAVRAVALETAKTASVPSLLSTILLAMAKAKTTTVLGITVVLLFAASLGLHLAINSTSHSTRLTTSQASQAAEPQPPGRVMPAERPSRLATFRSKADLQDLIANLQKALEAGTVDEAGYADSTRMLKAVRAFGRDKRSAIPVLLEALRSGNGEVRQCAMWGFHSMGLDAAAAIPDLVELARSTNEASSTRTFALSSLTAMAVHSGRPPAEPESAAVVAVAVPDLTLLLQDTDLEIRISAAIALGDLGGFAAEAVPALTKLLGCSASSADMTRRVRVSAVRALQLIGPPAEAAVPNLVELLGDTDTRTRESAAVALWRIAHRNEGAGVLAVGLYPPGMDDDWQERLQAVREMGAAAHTAVPNLEKLCKFADAHVREPALAVLRELDPKAADKAEARWKNKAGL